MAIRLCKARHAWLVGPLRPQLQTLLSQCQSPGAPHELSSSLPDALPAKATPVLEALRQCAALEAEHTELESQKDSEEDHELLRLYDAELDAAMARLREGDTRLELELLALRLPGEELAEAAISSRDAVVEISPGVGGQEAGLFAAELLRMYQRFAEQRGWTFDIEQLAEGVDGSLQTASAKVSGMVDDEGCGPFGWLQSESGVHRVQRVPVTDRKGRMQTSSATVVVMPVADEVDIHLPASDIKIEVTKKCSGPGGQSVNTAHQAIRATHLPTGIVVKSATSQSQFENRKLAIAKIRTMLLSQQLAARAEFERSERKQQRGTGDRSEKIRTYNFQRDDVVDHELGKEHGGVGHQAHDVVLGDGLQAILNAHRERARQDCLAQAVAALQKCLQKAE